MSVLIVFGSFSDRGMYSKIASALRKKGRKTNVKVLSAHRTPKELEKAIGKSAHRIVIAGAGLSAALPGVVASQTLKPVIGVPVSCNYSGLDALLSVHQLPGGISVLGVGVEQWKTATDFAALIDRGKFSGITLIKKRGKEFENAADRARFVLDELGIKYAVQEKEKFDDGGMIYVDFVKIGQRVPNSNGTCVIFVPVKKNSNANDSLKLLKMTKKGVWVGLNRGDNAALGAAQILGTKKALGAIKNFRQNNRKKILGGRP